MDGNDLKELRELVEFLRANEIAEFDMERPDLKVRLKFAGESVPAAAAPGLDMAQLARLMSSQQSAPPSLAAAAPAAPTVAAAAVPAAPAADPDAGMHIIKSPIVGTFYNSPSPGAEAFVKVGDKVEVGSVLCIVEAMKLMNEIDCDTAGEITRVLAEVGQPVEYGQPLFAIKPR